jgi:hypothetical protein
MRAYVYTHTGYRVAAQRPGDWWDTGDLHLHVAQNCAHLYRAHLACSTSIPLHFEHPRRSRVLSLFTFPLPRSLLLL